jgi:pyrimidine deaminase RibD-like protein
LIEAPVTVDTSDLEFMGQAVEAARLSVHEEGEPRPKVGAVLSTRGKFVASAFRGESAPGRHAEFELLEQKLKNTAAAGSTLYTTLEPCTVRNPPKQPCAEWILNREISRVVIGMLDPNQRICGKGIQRLREGGVQVDLFPPDLMAQVEEMNRTFIFYQKAKSAEEEEAIRKAQDAARFPVINPRYDDDLARLDLTFNLAALVSAETVFVVVGDDLVNELLDRHAAGLLRDAIDSLGDGRPFRRAVIVGAHASREHESLRNYVKRSPVISVGSEKANIATQLLQAQAETEGIQQFPLESGFGLYIAGPPRRAVLWGNTAKSTLAAVRRYIEHPDGLKAFLHV